VVSFCFSGLWNPRLVSALCSERYEFHKPVSIWIDCSKSARNEEPSSRGAFNSGLASGDSGLQLNLEIALSGVSAKVQSAFQLGRRCVETSDDVIKDRVQNPPHRVKPFSVSDLATWEQIGSRLNSESFFNTVFFSSSKAVAQTSGAGIGPKNIRIAFSLPITRTNSCTVQYMAMSTNKRI
jgi:hypothetical protein